MVGFTPAEKGRRVHQNSYNCKITWSILKKNRLIIIPAWFRQTWILPYEGHKYSVHPLIPLLCPLKKNTSLFLTCTSCTQISFCKHCWGSTPLLVLALVHQHFPPLRVRVQTFKSLCHLHKSLLPKHPGYHVTNQKKKKNISIQIKKWSTNIKTKLNPIL